MASESISYEAIGLILTALGTITGFSVFAMKQGRSQEKTQNTAESALQVAAAASQKVEEAHNRITIQSEAFGLYRERVAGEYVSRSTLREMEERVTLAIRDASRTSAEAIKGLTDRFNEVIENRHRA